MNEPIRARLFLLAPRAKSRRHHINKGWAWFEATRTQTIILQVVYCANGQASVDVSVHQLVVSALALDVQRLFDFPCTPFLLIVNDLRTVPRVARLDYMLCDRGPLRTLLLYVPFVLLQTLVKGSQRLTDVHSVTLHTGTL